MGKVNIKFIIDLVNISDAQLKAVCDHYKINSSIDSISPTVLEKKESVEKLRASVLGNIVNSATNKETKNIQPNGKDNIRFCFNGENSFVCLESKLSPSTHNIVLPDIITTQFGVCNVSFTDSIKLLIQSCISLDNSKVLLFPWGSLCTRQLVSVAKIFGLKLSSTQILCHGKLLGDFLKPLCAKSGVFMNSCSDMKLFDLTYFTFSMSDIFNCSLVSIFDSEFLTIIATGMGVTSPCGIINNLQTCDLCFLGGPCLPKAIKDLVSLKAQDEASLVPLEPEFRSGILQKEEINEKIKPKAKIKIVALESLDTVSPKQLNSVISYFDLDIPMAGKRNMKSIINKLFISSCYQQQLLMTPLKENLYCFDGQAEFVCMFTDLSELKHEISFTSSLKENFNFSSMSPNFSDCRKIIYQSYLGKKNCVLGLPWVALTQSQMVAIAMEKCPGLSMAKVLANPNIPSFLSACIRRSSTYKSQFDKASIFDSCLTFGFTLNSPLDVCDWSAGDLPEEVQFVAMHKDLFGSKNLQYVKNVETKQNVTNTGKKYKSIVVGTSIRESGPATNRDRNHSNESGTTDATVFKSVRYQEAACNKEGIVPDQSDVDSGLISSVSEKETLHLSDTSRSNKSKEISSNIQDNHYVLEESSTDNHSANKPIPFNVDSSNGSEGVKSDSNSIPSEISTDMKDTNFSDGNSINDISKKYQQDSVANITMYDTLDDTSGNVSVSSLYISSLSSPNKPLGSSTPSFKPPEIVKFSSILSERIQCSIDQSLNVDISLPDTESPVSADRYCYECTNLYAEERSLKCFLCKTVVHQTCYAQNITGKPLPPTYHAIAVDKLPNHKWFCNTCNSTDVDNLLQVMSLKVSQILLAESENATPDISSANEESKSLTVNHTQNSSPLENISDLAMKKDLHYDGALQTMEVAICKMSNALESIQLQNNSMKKSLYEHTNALKKDIQLIGGGLNNLQLQPNMHHDELQYINESLSDMNKKTTDNNEILKNIDTYVLKTVENSETIKTLLKNPLNLNDNYKSRHETSYSDVAKVSQYQGQTRKFQPLKTTVDPKKTVVINKDIDRNLVSQSSTIRSTFNKIFKNVPVNSAFTSKGGSIFIELQDQKSANEVIQKWQARFFAPTNTTEGTSCKLLTDLNKSVIIKNVPLDMEDCELTESLQQSFPEAKATRFIKRNGFKLKVIKIDFKNAVDQESCLKCGINIENLHLAAEVYKPRQRIIQCFNCLKFGHVAKLCKQENPTCSLCAESHSPDDCHKQHKKCANCQSDKHYATSTDCETYKRIKHLLWGKDDLNQN